MISITLEILSLFVRATSNTRTEPRRVTQLCHHFHHTGDPLSSRESEEQYQNRTSFIDSTVTWFPSHWRSSVYSLERQAIPEQNLLHQFNCHMIPITLEILCLLVRAKSNTRTEPNRVTQLSHVSITLKIPCLFVRARSNSRTKPIRVI
jgi:hypothetical protein